MLNKIIKNLKTGNYRIEYREHCDCRFDWRLKNGELVCDTVNYYSDCWINNILVMDDLAGQRDYTLCVSKAGIIASYDTYYGINVPIFNMRYGAERVILNAIKDSVEQVIINAIKNSDAYDKLTDGINTPNANNDLHDRRKREALVKWLSDNDHLRTYVYYPGDFANEYVCVLLTLPYYYGKKDYLQIPAHWLPKTAEEWAEMYLRKDTDGTQFDIGFELVNELYEIDYCWYNRHVDATISHEVEQRYFFIDLQTAENFLKTLDPDGLDCFNLDKLTIDSDDGEIDDIDCQRTLWGPEAVKEAHENGNPFVPEPENEGEKND